jgi:hypothetical protein
MAPFTSVANVKSSCIQVFNEELIDKSIIKFNDRFMDLSSDMIISNSYNSEWIKTFGGLKSETGYSVQQTVEGGFIITGSTESYGSGKTDVWLIKVDSYGNEQWNKTFGGSDIDLGFSVYQTTDGGYIITGYTDSYGVMIDLWLIKTDIDGNEQWNKTFGGKEIDTGIFVEQTSDGGYIIAGDTNSYAIGETDVWIIKTDETGNEQWNTTIGTIYDDEAWSVNQSTDGGFIIVGETDHDIWLIKLDGNGREEWNKTFGGLKIDRGYSVQQTMDGGFAFAGWTKSYTTTVYGDFWLVKTNAKGDEQWNKTYGWKKGDYGYSMQLTTDGGYIITGSTDINGPYDLDVWLVRTDSNGNKLWDKNLGGPYRDSGQSIQQTYDGGYIITGYTGIYGASNYDVLLIKVADFENQRPTPPVITGPSVGKKETWFDFNIVSTDPDKENLSYYIDWDDGNDEGWLGPYVSGNEIEVRHYWLWEDTFIIKVKAEDVYGGESDWSEFEIKISNSRTRTWVQFLDMFPILQKFLDFLK